MTNHDIGDVQNIIGIYKYFFLLEKGVNTAENLGSICFSMQQAEIGKIGAQRDESHINQSSYVATRDEKKRQVGILSSW